MNEKSRPAEPQFKEDKSGNDDLVADAIDRYLEEQRMPAKKQSSRDAVGDKRD